MRRFVAALALVCASACHVVQEPLATPPAPVPQAPAAGVRHTHENLNAVLWMQTAVEYRATAMQAYRAARVQLDAALADPNWTAAVEQTGGYAGLPPAVVLDLDETVLDNSAYAARQLSDATTYTPESWAAWVNERKGPAIPGAVEFLKYAASRGVTPFYVTNRMHDVESATRDTLARLGLPLDAARDTVLTRGEQGWTESDKGSRRRAIAGAFRILLLVGDNFEDFVSGTLTTVDARFAIADRYAEYWGARWIVLPNPTYGSWESAITSGQGRLSDAATLAAKYKALDTAR